mgnify:CR=1 FL=1
MMAEHKSSENMVDGLTITPKFLDIDSKNNGHPQILNEEIDSDKL